MLLNSFLLPWVMDRARIFPKQKHVLNYLRLTGYFTPSSKYFLQFDLIGFFETVSSHMRQNFNLIFGIASKKMILKKSFDR